MLSMKTRYREPLKDSKDAELFKPFRAKFVTLQFTSV